MSKKYIVTLTDEERQILEQLTKKGKSPVYEVNQARILLLADMRNEDGAWTDQSISKALNISIPTIILRLLSKKVEPIIRLNRSC